MQDSKHKVLSLLYDVIVSMQELSSRSLECNVSMCPYWLLKILEQWDNMLYLMVQKQFVCMQFTRCIQFYRTTTEEICATSYSTEMKPRFAVAFRGVPRPKIPEWERPRTCT